MDFIKKNKTDGTFSEVEDISDWKASDFKQHELFFVSKINEKNFKDSVRRHEILKTQMEIQANHEKLQKLMGSNPPPSLPQSPNVLLPPQVNQNPLDAQTSIPVNTPKGLINPVTKAPFSKEELDAIFTEMKDVIENKEEFAAVINCENNGDHFLVRANEPVRLPKYYKGVPVVFVVDG